MATLESRPPPAERFKDAGAVREFAHHLIRADQPRAAARAKIQGMVDGNRPLPQGVLNAQQQGWRANVNYREGEGQVSSQRTPYYDLAMENDPCLEVEIDYGHGQQRAEWERKVAAHLHWCFQGWEQFNWHLQLQQSEMVVHGIGTHVFLSKVDWRPKTLTMRHVLFPDRTNSCIDDGMEAFVVREPLRAHQLLRHAKEASGKIGWRIAAVEETVRKAWEESASGKQRNDEDYQALAKNNDLGFSYNSAREIWLNHVFTRDFDDPDGRRGGISHAIVEEGGEKYLFKSKKRRFDDWNNILTVFPYDIGSDGTIHSIRGLGARIFPFIELSNKLKNHMVDSVLIGAGMMLADNGIDLTKLALTRIGPLQILPKGASPVTWKAMDLSQGPLALAENLKSTSDENNRVYRQSPSERSYAQTAEEVRTNASSQAAIQKSAHNMYYGCLDQLYTEMVRRACNPNYTTKMPGGQRAVEFQRRCFRDGVPKEALAKIVSVRAARALGAGSAMNRIMIARELMQMIYPGADEVSRFNLKADYVAALSNSRHVSRYVTPVDEAMAPDNDDSVAVLENDVLMRGGEALVNSRQNHFKHSMRHMMKAGEMLQALQQGQAEPMQVLQAWEAIGPHTAAHLAYLEQDPTRKQQFEHLNQNFMMLSKTADKLRQHLEEQAKQQAAQAALFPPEQPAPVGPFDDPKLNLEYMRTQGQLQIKAAKETEAMRLKREKQEANIALADTKAAAELRRKAQQPAQNGSA